MTYLLLDSSTPLCKITIITSDNAWHEHEWQADRTLAHGLLKHLTNTLAEHGETLHSLSGLAVFQGPGSFTGLRIGITVLNTLADSESIPIVGASGEDWQEVAVERLKNGENDRLVMPFYGADARITKPRK